MTTIAIFGAGPGLGLAVARRFGREDFTVALAARNQGKLDTMVSSLAGEGIQAAGFTADLTERAGVLRAVDAIEARFGPIDVLEYSPDGDGNLRRQASQIDTAVMEPLLATYVMTPVALVSRVLPGMRERGNGRLLFALGAAAKYPVPQLASAGMALSGLRSYVHDLHTELAPSGVYAGALVIGALIEGTPAHQNASAWGSDVPVVAADDLAEREWDMYLNRDRAEEEITPGVADSPARGNES